MVKSLTGNALYKEFLGTPPSGRLIVIFIGFLFLTSLAATVFFTSVKKDRMQDVKSYWACSSGCSGNRRFSFRRGVSWHTSYHKCYAGNLYWGGIFYDCSLCYKQEPVTVLLNVNGLQPQAVAR